MLQELNADYANTASADVNTLKALKAALKLKISHEDKKELTVRQAVELFLALIAEQDSTIDTEAFADTNQFEVAWFHFYTPYVKDVVISFHA